MSLYDDLFGSGINWDVPLSDSITLCATYKMQAEVKLPEFLVKHLKAYSLSVFAHEKQPVGLLLLDFQSGKSDVFRRSLKEALIGFFTGLTKEHDVVFAAKGDAMKIQAELGTMIDIVDTLNGLGFRNDLLTQANTLHLVRMTATPPEIKKSL